MRAFARHTYRRRSEAEAATLAYVRGLFGMPEPQLLPAGDDSMETLFDDFAPERFPASPVHTPVTVFSAAALRARLDAARPVAAEPPGVSASLVPPGGAAVPVVEPDGPVGALGFRLGGVVAQLSGLTHQLVRALCDDAGRPAATRDVTDVMNEVYPGEEGADGKFKALVFDTNKRLGSSGVPFRIDRRAGRVVMIPDQATPTTASPELPEISPESGLVLPARSPGSTASSA